MPDAVNSDMAAPLNGSAAATDGKTAGRPSLASSSNKVRPSLGSTTASTAAPRPSAVTTISGNSYAIQDDAETPELTGGRDGGNLRHSSSHVENLGPRDCSFVGAPAQAPAGSDDERLTGLTEAAVAELRLQWGMNEIPEQVTAWYVMLGKQFVGMMPFMLEVAAVLSAATGDWADFGIITLMLLVNGLIGFHEEHKAKQSLDALKGEMTATVPVKRDGTMVIKPVAELVPGDIVFLRGGNVVPADCEWLEGDPMLVDTAALTGEPLPRKVPRQEREDEAPGAGRQLLSGCIIKQGEGHCEVKETGLRTEIGQAAELVMDASGHQAGVFETKIMQVVRAVIIVTLIDAAVVLYVDVAVRKEKFTDSLLGVLALVIGAVPIALPLVMQVTMAIGAAQMAKRKAIVTHLTALQEIASMTVLCSDKTGTLTTADMRVMPDKIWVSKGNSKEEALLWSGVASNPANKEDPIDKAVLKSVAEKYGSEAAAEAKLSVYRKNKFVGFNPTVKRTVAYCSHPEHGEIKIAKGLVDKVLSTGDDGGDCWECADLATVQEEVKEVDYQCSVQGYKTVGVAVSKNNEPMRFAAIVPMLDPPRSDTMLTIHRIRMSGVSVKMITGDHLNIAVETSRLIGLGTAIHPASDLWPASATRDELIYSADGFAQVLPKDKRECILVLQNKGLVVGMTGDGVNDAPALAQAQIGIAVDGASEAARSAADIVLTSPGLSAIFDAVAESRMIFARLRAYVLYRLAATIQIVLVLSFLIYRYNDPLPALYVILLALLNDVSMLPIAADNASASALPEIPSMPSILLSSFIYGALETAQTMILYIGGWIGGGESDEYRSAVIYLQISIGIELLIFSCRAPGFVLSPQALWKGGRPTLSLTCSVFGANILVSVLAGFGDVFGIIHKVEWVDIAWIWLYDIAWLLAIDLLKTLLWSLGLGWMSAGAVGGILEYSDLPTDMDQNVNRSTLARSVASARSLVPSANLFPPSSSATSGGSQIRHQSESTLPYPYNLRAAALRHYQSF